MTYQPLVLRIPLGPEDDMSVGLTRKCESCGGSGWDRIDTDVYCDACYGSGSEPTRNGAVILELMKRHGQ